MRKEVRNIIDIIPIARIPLSRNQSFSYLHDQKLLPGTLVTIPLFRRKVSGIVTGHRPDFERLGNIELKKIESVTEESFLTKNQLLLAQFISDYYLSPLGIVLKSFVPKIVKQHKTKNAASKEISRPKINLTKEQQSAVNTVTTNQKLKTKNFLLYGPASSGKTEIYIHSVLKLKEQNPNAQFLILLPELTLTPQAIERYGEYFDSSETVVLHSKIGKGQFYTDWQKIKSGEAKIIIGSRMAVFAPFKNLALIAVDEEQDMSFKQWDMNPHYDARTVAEKLAERHQCKIVFGSATPRVESYHKATIGEYKLLELPILRLPTTNHQPPTTNLELVDMKKERWIKNYSPISKKLQAEISYALKNKLQTILFINRQGMSNFSICTQCKTVLKCPKCDRALIYDKEGIYKCVHCAYKTSITPECSKCNSLSFTNIGLGTQKVEREIVMMFPGARVARADNQSMKTPHAQEILYADFRDGNIDILIGTQMISKGWDLPNVALVGIIDGDALLSMPDFSTEEKVYQSIMQASGRVGRLGAKFPGVVLVQTFNPQQNFWKNLVAKEFSKFYEKELKERKDLKLPPFGKLIKLTFQDYATKKVATEADRVFALLEEKSDMNVKVSEPQDAFVSNVRGRFRKQILLKISGDIPENIKQLLQSLPVGWNIDVDPISII
ncbi:MAG: primosomal protein N' [Parcubacteria group bacterium]|jgi:primosomal protein N' (replication factor Y)